MLETLERIGNHRPVASLETVPRLFREHRVRCLASRDVRCRKVELAETEVEVAACGDLESGVARPGQCFEQAAHLGAGFEPEFGVGSVEGTGKRHARTRRREHVVEAEVVRAQVVDVVRGDDRQREVLGKPRQTAHEPRCIGRELVYELDVEVAGLETRREST